MNKVYRVSDYIADFISEKKIKHVFLLPGGGNMHLVDAVAKSKKLHPISLLHEQAVSISSEAYSRINNNIGVSIVTTGPGSTNAITGVVGAWIESIPMVVISGQVKSSDMINKESLRQKGVQEVNIINLVKDITKYSITIKNPKDIKSILQKAFYFATSGRCGPVWIDVPLDIQGSPVVKKSLRSWNQKISKFKYNVNQINNLKKAILKSKRPLILAGHGIRLSGGDKVFQKVINQLGIPFVTTWNSFDLLPHNHKLNIGKPGVVALRAPNFAVQNCDLLISIGSRLDNIITAFNPKRFASNAKKIIVDIDNNEIKKLKMKIFLKFNLDAKFFLDTIYKKLKIKKLDISDWQKKCLQWKENYSIENTFKFNNKGKISHYNFVNTLSKILPENIVIATGSSGLGIEVFYTIFKNKKNQRIFLTSGLGSMGYGLPAAIGAYYSNFKKPLVLIEGDGSFQMNIQELALIKSYKIPICIIVMNNKGYASIRNTQKGYFNSRFIGTGPEAGILYPNLEKISKAYNIPFLRISNVSNLEKELKKSMNRSWPLLVEINLIKNESLRPKVEALPQPDGSIVSMPLEDMSPLLPLKLLRKEMLTQLSKFSINARKLIK